MDFLFVLFFTILNKKETKIIKNNGILIDTTVTSNFSDMYSKAGDSILLTKDFVFHKYALVYKYSTKRVENNLYKKIKELLLDLYIKAYERYMVERDFMKSKWDMVLIFLNAGLLVAKEDISPPPNIAPAVFELSKSINNSKDSLKTLMTYISKQIPAQNEDSLFSLMLIADIMDKKTIKTLENIITICSTLYGVKVESPVLDIKTFFDKKNINNIYYDKELINNVKIFIQNKKIGEIITLQYREKSLQDFEITDYNRDKVVRYLMEIEEKGNYPIDSTNYEVSQKMTTVFLDDFNLNTIDSLKSKMLKIRNFLNTTVYIDSMIAALEAIKEGKGLSAFQKLMKINLERKSKVCDNKLCTDLPWLMYTLKNEQIVKGFIYSIYLNNEVPRSIIECIKKY